jgi:hypothetical protein
MGDAMSIQEIYDALAAPFPVEEISWRVGPTNERSRREDQPLRGQPLCYVDARTVMDRLDSVVGFDNWQCSYTPGVATSIVCNIGVRLLNDWIWKADGAGATDMEADKGALSDAFKRAAVRWGVGRYLYELKAPWIALEQRGKSSFIPEATYNDLNKLHDDFARRAGWGDAAGVAAYRLLTADLERQSVEARVTFVERHADRIAALPPAMRKHLLNKLEAAA